jgi:hypothetical protein
MRDQLAKNLGLSLSPVLVSRRLAASGHSIIASVAAFLVPRHRRTARGRLGAYAFLTNRYDIEHVLPVETYRDWSTAFCHRILIFVGLTHQYDLTAVLDHCHNWPFPAKCVYCNLLPGLELLFHRPILR